MWANCGMGACKGLIVGLAGGAFAGIAEAAERRRAARGKIAEFKLPEVRGSA